MKFKTFCIVFISCVLTSTKLICGGQQSSLTPLSAHISQGLTLFNEGNYAEALEFYAKAYAESRSQNDQYMHAVAAHHLGIIHLKQANQRDALKFLHEAYTLGKNDSRLIDLMAQSADHIGRIYADGLVVDKNLEKAFSYFKEASELIKASANKPLQNTIKNDFKHLLSLMWKEGVRYNNQQQYPQAFELLIKVYRNSMNDYEVHAGAAQSLGEMYQAGNGVPQNGLQARAYFIEAYKLSMPKLNASLLDLHSFAALKIGETYFHSMAEVDKDFKKAFEYFNASHSFGSSHTEGLAAVYLGEMYMLGKGVSRDFEQARKYLEEAYKYKTSSAYPAVLNNLGVIYREIDKDYDRALKYFYEVLSSSSAKQEDRINAKYNLYIAQLSLLNKFDSKLESIKDNPTEKSIKQLENILVQAEAIKFIGNEYSNQIKDRLALLDSIKQQLQRQECVPQIESNQVDQKQTLFETGQEKNEPEPTTDLLREFDALLMTYKSQEAISNKQFEEARKILLQALLGANLEARLRLQENFGDLAKEHAKKQKDLRMLLKEIYQDADRYTDDSFSLAQKNLHAAQALVGDDTQLQNEIEEVGKYLQEKIEQKAQQIRPSIEPANEEDEKEPEQLFKRKDREGALRTVTASEVEKVLISVGFEKMPTTGGSHVKYKQGNKTVSVPFHAQESLKKGTFKNILRQAGISSEKFNNLLDTI